MTARRPVFVPVEDGPIFVEEKQIDFEWYPGVAVSQAQKCIRSLHAAAKKEGIDPILEISSKSLDALGVKLSAFNLMLEHKQYGKISVECAFHGSKVFENNITYTELYKVSSREAKQDERLRNSGEIIRFEFEGKTFPTNPPTAFYDWLYLKALVQDKELSQNLLDRKYKGFTDIAFNPKKSINCQARSAALFVALHLRKVEVEKVVDDIDYYLRLIGGQQSIGETQ